MATGDWSYTMSSTATTANLNWDYYSCPAQAYVPCPQNVYIGGSPINQPQIQEERRYNMKGLYDVYLCYGEDRKSPVIKRAEGIIADSDEDAKIKSGLMAQVDASWDADYLTFIVNKIGDIKVKPKPQETKSV
jgi:hypothetical protein